jgi:2-polyprenyl-6-methoxyphenol hydroxylase-like FAD-dependent oxidoreductase
MSGTDFDVVQIGYGPVGQTFAALAGKLGWKVGVFERYPSLYGLPRAGHIDHEIMRIFQSLGCAETVERNAIRSNKYEWRNAAGQVLLDFEWNADGISGWPSDYLIFQPDLEDVLDDAIRSTPTISVHFGWEAVGIIQFPDHVELTVRDAANPRMIKKVTSRYLVAADGGNSFARKALGIEWRDLGFSQPWLVVDFREKRPLSLPFENGQICDPARPIEGDAGRGGVGKAGRHCMVACPAVGWTRRCRAHPPSYICLRVEAARQLEGRRNFLYGGFRARHAAVYGPGHVLRHSRRRQPCVEACSRPCRTVGGDSAR